MPRLVFQIGDGKTVDFDLSGTVVTLGRSTSNDIVINNSWISSHHAKFERSGGNIEVMSLGSLHGIPLKEFKRVGGEYTVTDLDSHNGVMVNGQKVTSQRLKPGDILSFGQLQAVFQDATAPAPGTKSGDTPFAASATDTATPRPVTQRLVKKLHASPPPHSLPLSAPTIPLFSQPRPQPTPATPPPPTAAPAPTPAPPLPASKDVTSPPAASRTPDPEKPAAIPPPPEPETAQPRSAPTPPPADPAPAAAPPPSAPLPSASPRTDTLPADTLPADTLPENQAPAEAPLPTPPPSRPAPDPPVAWEEGDPAVVREPAAAAPLAVSLDAPPATRPALPPSARSVLASLHRDVALLEESIGALHGAAEKPAEPDHAFARGLIQRIDLLEDLMASAEIRMAGVANRLVPLHGSLLDLLREFAIEPFTLAVGHPLDVASRKRITIMEAAPEGEGVTEIAEVFRPGYQWFPPPPGAPPVILRKAEVRTIRRTLAQVT